MRVLVAGSRSIRRYAHVARILRDMIPLTTTVIISGGASGVDSLAELWAKKMGFRVERYKADWKKYGKGAGFIRNKRMLDEGRPDRAIIIWDGKSVGTKHMRSLLERAGICTFIFKSGKAVVHLGGSR